VQYCAILMILFIGTWFTGTVRLNDLQWLIVDVGCWHHVGSAADGLEECVVSSFSVEVSGMSKSWGYLGR